MQTNVPASTQFDFNLTKFHSDMFLMQRLNLAMQRGNAACILGTIADNDFQLNVFV